MPETLTWMATIAEILGGATVLGGVGFAIFQVRQYRRQRADQAAIELMRSMMTPHFIQTYRLLSPLDPGVGVEEMRELGTEYEEAAFAVATIYETLGYMVYRGVVPLPFVDELLGGIATSTWRKVETYFNDLRANEGEELLVEWFQWLVERLEERGPKTDRTPAYRLHAGWQQPRMT